MAGRPLGSVVPSPNLLMGLCRGRSWASCGPACCRGHDKVGGWGHAGGGPSHQAAWLGPGRGFRPRVQVPRPRKQGGRGRPCSGLDRRVSSRPAESPRASAPFHLMPLGGAHRTSLALALTSMGPWASRSLASPPAPEAALQRPPSPLAAWALRSFRRAGPTSQVRLSKLFGH